MLELLHIKDKNLARQFLRVATSTISAMVTNHPAETKTHLIDPVLKPLTSCLEKSGKFAYLYTQIEIVIFRFCYRPHPGWGDFPACITGHMTKGGCIQGGSPSRGSAPKSPTPETHGILRDTVNSGRYASY